jgi:pimeloyl-ACP methyl ester carboxylesterase
LVVFLLGQSSVAMRLGTIVKRLGLGLFVSVFSSSIGTGCKAIKLKSVWLSPSHLRLGNNGDFDASNGYLRDLLQRNQGIQVAPLCEGYLIDRGGSTERLSTAFHGFSWVPSDFQKIVLIGHYGNQRLKTKQIGAGIGVPVVLLRESRTSRSLEHEPTSDPHKEFLGPISAIAATAVLSEDGNTIDFYNPVTIRQIELDGIPMRLAYDKTASIAYMLHHHPQTRYRDFIFPEQSTDQSRLTMLEPFEPNKIPLILVHGLLSSPDTYGELYNQLRTDPVLMDDYQVWVFKYATGRPFIRAASDLREELDRVIAVYDPDLSNQYLRSSVLVGHSMGGLITRLLISYSSEHVWNSVSRVPLEVLATDEKTRANFAERFYFDPHPLISRAVFIATPHRGSSTAGRALGKFASAIVVQSDTGIEKILHDNPGAIRDTLADGLPTSIDMLDPNQPFLRILAGLQMSESVSKHSIIGVGGPVMGLFQTDGLVPLESAKLDGVATERRISTSHNGILKHPETALELRRILLDHLDSVNGQLDSLPADNLP